MSFGFSIGDIIACSQLAAQTYSALKTAPKEFEGLRLEVRSLNATLKALGDEERSPTSLIHAASPSRRDDLRMLMENATNSMDDLQKLVLKYSSLGSTEKRRFTEWVRFASKDKQGARDKLAIHTASINMFLTTLTHGSLGRLEFLLKNARQSHPSNAPKPTTGSGHFGTVGSRDPNVQANGTAWMALGNDMSTEGITEQHVEQYQEYLKAYLRHLVRGEMPFWSERTTTKVQAASTREVHTRSSVKEELKRHRAEKDAEERQRYEGGAQKTEEKARMEAEERERREMERYYRERFEKESKWTEESEEARDKMKELRLRREEEEMRRLRAERDEMERRETTRSDAVSQLMEEFEGLFDLDYDTGLRDDADADSISALSDEDNYSDHLVEAVPGPGPIRAEFESADQSPRLAVSPFVKEKAKRIREDRQKLEKLVEKRDRARKAGDQMMLNDLATYAIPETTKRLKDLGCRFDCDYCQLPIGSARFHCGICNKNKGEWDICGTCREKGKGCLKPEHKLKQVSLEEDLSK